SWTNHNPTEAPLHSVAINAIKTDRWGNKWVGTDRGVSKFDGENWNTYNITNSGLASDTVYAVAVDAVGNKWFGTQRGISKFDGTNWTSYLINLKIKAIAIDSQQNKWFADGNYAGIYQFDGTTWTNYASNFLLSTAAVDKRGTQWFGGDSYAYKFNGTKFTTFSQVSSIKGMAIDGQNNKWFVSSYYGVSKSDDGTNWTNYTTNNYPSLLSDNLTSIAIDAQNNKWFGTKYNGIAVLNADGSWSNYTASTNRLISNYITAIAVDAQGNKWIGTNGGISKLQICNLSVDSVAVQAATCRQANGRLTVRTSGGAGKMTYSVDNTNFQNSPVFNNLLGGTYQVIAKDSNGCIATYANSLIRTIIPTIHQVIVQNNTCGLPNGQILVKAIGGKLNYSRDGVTYQADSLFKSLAAGSYQVFIKDSNNCVVNSSYYTLQNTTPVATITDVKNAACDLANGQFNVQVVGGIRPLSYSLNGSNFQNSSFFSQLNAGTYRATVKDAGDCVVTSTDMTVQNGTQSWKHYFGNPALTTAVAIDADGTKWFGTYQGVYKFDGMNWTHYHSSNSPLVANEIRAIAIDAQGNKWFGGYGGVSKFDGNAWTNYTPSNSQIGSLYIHSVAADAQGNMWFGTEENGVSKFNGVTWTIYNRNNSSIAGNRVQAIAVDAQGNKWFGTDSYGVSKFNGTNWATYTTSDGLLSNNIRAIGIDAQDNKWFGTGANGLSKFDNTNWTTYVTANGQALYSVGGITSDAQGNQWFASNDRIYKYNNGTWEVFNGAISYGYSIGVDPQGNKWIGSSAGVFKFDGNNWTNPTPPQLLVNANAVSCHAKDNQGNMWFGTKGWGILKFDGTNWMRYDTSNSPRDMSYIVSMASDAQNNKWFGTYFSGVYKFDGTNWTPYTTTNSGIGANYISSIATDAQGNKWFCFSSGVSKYDGVSWTTYNSPLSNLKQMVIDVQGNKWFSSSNGVYKFDDATWTNYNTSNTSGLFSNDIISLAADAQGNKWFGTNWTGLYKFDGTVWTYYNTLNSALPQNYVGGIAVDAQNHKWFGTYGGGLCKFDGTNWTIYNTSNSKVLANYVQSVGLDAQGNKWMSTWGGLSKLESCAWAVSSSVQHATCSRANGTLTAQTTGGAGTMTYALDNGIYQTSNIFNNLSVGTYRVSAKDANGNVVTSDTVRVNNLSVSTPVSFTFARQANRGIRFTNTTPIANLTNPSYAWTFGDGQTSTIANPIVTYLQSGTYTVKLLVKNNGSELCRDSSSQVILNVPTEDLSQWKISLYPNPVSETLTLETPIATQVRILNSVGEVVQTLPLNVGKNLLPVQNLATGTYWIQYQGGALKFIKQ
ncbi:MAG: hypothetical protein RLZZ628_2195, partial [Bacteroidota bacterium]